MREIDSSLSKLIGTLFPILGTGLLLASIISTILTFRFIDEAERIAGKVVRLNAGGAHPVIEFKPQGEGVLRHYGSGFIYYAVGDSVTVLYLKDPQSPAGFQARIDTPGALWDGTLVFIWLGGGLIVGGLYTKRSTKKPPARSRRRE